MLADADALFEHMPGSFGDPLGLAAQQGPGTLSLIVAHYAGGEETTYDAFVTTDGRVVAVARVTPAFRFAVMPATALERFFTRRAEGEPVSLCLYRLDAASCRRFLESVFYVECLKLHVAGDADAETVARQLAASGCAGDGLVEVNDFSDPTRPRVLLVELADVLALADELASGDVPPTNPLSAALARLLDGVCGRVLLYDRARNAAIAVDRAAEALDVDHAIAQAARLAQASPVARAAVPARASAPRAHPEPIPLPERTASIHFAPAVLPPPDGQPDTSPPDEGATLADAPPPSPESVVVEPSDAEARLLAALHHAPEPTDAASPAEAGFAALLAELQGGAPAGAPVAPGLAPFLPALATPRPEPLPAEPDDEPDDEGAGRRAGEPALPSETATTDSTPYKAPAEEPPPEPPAPIEHPLAAELDRLRTKIVGEVEEHVGRERTAELETAVLSDLGFPRPIPPERTVAFLRALLTHPPPKRWHFFKRARGKAYPLAARALHSFFLAHSHLDLPVVQEASELWARLHR